MRNLLALGSYTRHSLRYANLQTCKKNQPASLLGAASRTYVSIREPGVDPTVKVSLCEEALLLQLFKRISLGCRHFQKTKAHIVLKNGKTLSGYSFGYEQAKAGEIVFNTGLVG